MLHFVSHREYEPAASEYDEPDECLRATKPWTRGRTTHDEEPHLNGQGADQRDARERRTPSPTWAMLTKLPRAVLHILNSANSPNENR